MTERILSPNYGEKQAETRAAIAGQCSGLSRFARNPGLYLFLKTLIRLWRNWSVA